MKEELAFLLGNASAPQFLGTTARCLSMEHMNPPENLPVVPEPVETELEDDVHFRDQESGDSVHRGQQAGAPESREASPPHRSLQLIHEKMHEIQTGVPVRTPDDLLEVNEVADYLRCSRAAVYRLVARRRIAFFRLPSGLRFKVSDLDSFLKNRRSEARPPKRYGRI
jgi:excisionase family DNA binding protein